MRHRDVLNRIDRSLDRIDQHVERGAVAMERNERAFERNTAAFDRNTEAFERNMAASDDFHVFMHEMTLRVQKIGEAQMASLERVLGELGDLRAESRAQRQALLAMIDRLGPSGPAAAT